MKRFTLSLVILGMVMGTMALDVYAGGRGRSGGNFGKSRGNFSGSKRNFQSSSSKRNFQSSSFKKKFNSPSMKSTPKFNHNFSNKQINHNKFSNVHSKNTHFKPHTNMKQIQPIKKVHSGFNHKKPGSGFTRPNQKPFNGKNTLKPKPFPKPIDPGFGNGQSGKKPFDNIKPRPRPSKPFPGKPILPKPGKGHGPHGGKLAGKHHGHHNGHHHGHNHWHNHRPRFSWWWYNYCTPLRNCVPGNYQYCNYVYPTCDYVAPSGVVVEDVRWFLGLKGMMLPGKGIGVETVAENSPAAAVGLQPGMVITKCNGVVITDNEVFGQVIAQSGGVLEMELLESIEGEPLQATVQMTQLPAASF